MMGNDGSVVKDLLEKLSVASEEERKRLLETVAPILSSPSARSTYKAQLEASNLNVVFDCVNASSSQLVLVAADVIRNILEFVDPSIILETYFGCLLRCLNHPYPQVRSAALQFFKSCQLWDPVTLQLLVSNDRLLLAVVKALIDPDSMVAKDAKLAAYYLAQKQSPSDNFMFKGTVLPLLQEMSHDSNEVMRLRIYEFAVLVAKLSPEFTKRIVKAGFLQDLLKELNSGDVLIQLNVLEILSDLAEAPHGYELLKRQKTLDLLDQLLEKSSASPHASLLLPGFIDFFGKISSNRQTVDFVSCFPSFTSTIFKLLSQGEIADEGLKALALATVGQIARGLNGKRQLNRVGGENILNMLVKYCTRGSSHQKLCALNTISSMLLTKEIEDPADLSEACVLTEKFFELLESLMTTNQSLTGITLDIAKQPFADMSMAAYEVFKNMADKKWGLSRLTSHPGLTEFLLNRGGATSKQAKDVKYELVRAMADNPAAEDLISPEILTRMRRYVKEGAYYVDPEVEVALDEG